MAGREVDDVVISGFCLRPDDGEERVSTKYKYL